MKTILLIRHGKSDWGYEFLNDIDRPLNERGYRETYQQSKWAKDNLPTPQLIISSPAIRAISTALIFARELNYNEQDILIRHGIYDATTDDFLNNIHLLPTAIHTVLFFGHNPTITNLSNLLSSESFINNIPTSGIVRLDFNTNEWTKIGELKSSQFAYKFVK